MFSFFNLDIDFKTIKEYWKFVFRFLRPYKHLILAGLLCGLIAMIALHSVPIILKYIIDIVIPSNDSKLMLTVIGILFGVVIFGSILTLVYIYLVMLVRERASLDISTIIFSRAENTSLQNADKIKIGDAITTINNDSSRSVDFVLNLVDELTLNIALLLYIFIILFVLEFRLLLLSLIILPLLIYSQLYFGKILHKKASLLRNSFGDYISFVEERLRNIKLVQLFRREKEESDNFRKKGELVVNQTVDISLYSEYSIAASTFLTHFALVSVLGFSAYLVMRGDITTGTLVAFYGYQISLYAPVKKILHTYSKLKQDMVGVERVKKLYNDTQPLNEPMNPKHVPSHPKKIISEEVGLNIDGKQILENLSFEIETGKIIGLTGPSGSGKTTILNLLYRFIDPDKGRILLDGTDIKEFGVHDYRKLIAYLPSKPDLLDDTILNNIRFANKHISIKQVEFACRLANIHKYITTLKDGYNTHLGTLGDELSEGQKQRIAIARAILKSPKIYLLDETTAAFDAETEKYISLVLSRLKDAKRTIIIVTHRISFLRNTDKILVIDKGTVIEQGTYKELMEKDSKLKKFRMLQEK